ncbi:MAG: hypothetical protein ACI88C_000660 [Acidimicrobiales bacterium]
MVSAAKRLVERSDIVDLATYEDSRSTTRPSALAAKKARRLHLHENLTMLFENSDTLRYQIHEIMRAERMVCEADILHEIATYNAILGSPGDLGSVLLIGITDETQRRRFLTKWVGLQERLYVVLNDGSRVFARFDPAQVGKDRISAVHYLWFPVDGRVPVAIGTDFEGLESELTLTPEHVAAFTEDLART